MAHEIDETTGKAAFTWLEDTALPWHGLGQPTPANSPLSVWQANGGLDYQVEPKTLGFTDDDGAFQVIKDMNALVRSDTNQPLSTMSTNRYHVHQPSEVLEFFQRWLDENKLTMETCGALRGGRVIFALARMSDKFNLDIGGDLIAPYMLLGTSFDGSLATHATVTSIRVVCANTHSAAMAESADKVFKQKHTKMFDKGALQHALERSDEEIAERARLFNRMADTAMTADQINDYLIRDVLDIDPDDLSKVDKANKPLVSTKSQNLIALLQRSYTDGPGADIAKGTAWGAYNAVTHFVDHSARTRDTNGDGQGLSRLASAWYGAGAQMKKRALDRLLARTEIKVAA